MYGLNGVIMPRWRAETKQDVSNCDGCGFSEYRYILLGPTSLVPFNKSHKFVGSGFESLRGHHKNSRQWQ